MIDNLWDKASGLDSDCIDAAMHDWNVLGIFYGFRLSEWAQNNENKKSFPHPCADGKPIAFTFNDMVFYGKNKQRINNSFKKKLTLKDVYSVEFRWRYQKNLDNGQKISQTRNDTSVHR